jgi:GxxExxY protein
LLNLDDSLSVITTEHTEPTEGGRDPLSRKVIGCAIEVHRTLGPGLLESAYEQCLAHELRLKGLEFRLQVPVPVKYKGILLHCGYRADLIVEDFLLIELKAVEQITRLHDAQIITYLKLANIPTGLILNFNTRILKEGIRRFKS